MGDLHRHAEVSRHVIDAMVKIRPQEDYVCLELGNYLTDLSQFRDPFAHMNAKHDVWARATRKGWLGILSFIPVVGTIAVDLILDLGVDLDGWINKLLGEHEPPDRRHGMFAGYMKEAIRGVTHTLFAEGAPKSDDLKARILPQIEGLALLKEAELDRLFEAHFTQYWPHEHTDMPPYVLYGEHRPRHRAYRRGPRGLSNYLEEYIEYLSESLTKLEVDWKACSNQAQDAPERHEALVRLGKVLHGVEDYFFHSNYCELHLWHSLRRGRPTTETDDAYRTWFVANVRAHWLPQDVERALKDSFDDSFVPSQAHQLRAFLRRLRYPAYRPVNTVDPGTSLPSLDHLFTAGFDKKDLFHTLAMALESMEAPLSRVQRVEVVVPQAIVEAFQPAARAAQLRDSSLVLVRTIFNHSFRSAMGKDGDELEKQLGVHAAQLGSGVYDTSIDQLETKGYLNHTAAAAWRRALAIDKDLESFGAMTPGVGGFLMSFFSEAQSELEKSRRTSRRHDLSREFGEGNILDERSDNGATGEHIGMHAMQSKDTPRSQPMHEEAKRLARFASMAVASLLVTEVNRTPSTAQGLDWDVILRHYLRFPDGKPAMWESQVLAHYRTNRVDPAYDEIPDRVPAPLASGPQALTRVAKRRGGSKRAELEKRYVKLEERVDRIGNIF
jgi:hypothetical protein